MDKSMNVGTDHTLGPDANPPADKPRARPHAPATFGALIGSLWRDTSELAAQQAELAKAEATDKISQLAMGAGAIAASGAIMLAGFIVLLLSAVNALIPLFDPEYTAWLSPLIVGGIVVAVGYAMFASGRKAMSAQYLKPSRTIESMRRNTEMVKEHTK